MLWMFARSVRVNYKVNKRNCGHAESMYVFAMYPFWNMSFLLNSLFHNTYSKAFKVLLASILAFGSLGRVNFTSICILVYKYAFELAVDLWDRQVIYQHNYVTLVILAFLNKMWRHLLLHFVAIVHTESILRTETENINKNLWNFVFFDKMVSYYHE